MSCIISLVIMIIGIINAPKLTVVFIDVGQGDSSLIMSGDTSILIDGGLEEQGQYAVAGVLDYYGISKVDLAVATHMDEDHIGGLRYLDTEGRVDTMLTCFDLKAGDSIYVNEDIRLDCLWPYEVTDGGNEDSTHELVSKKLGKETISADSYTESKGRNGSYSKNTSLTGRNLMLPEEVRMLDNRYALLFVRGENAVMDEKYDLMKHPNIALSTDGGAAPYEHGLAPLAFDPETIILDDESYVVLSSEEIQEILEEEREKQYQERQEQNQHK